jgi:hypothetical protein
MTRLFYGPFLFLLLLLAGCRQAAVCQEIPDDGPYIDSIGFEAAQSRMDAIENGSPDSLINKAFQTHQKENSSSIKQSEFFQSIEEDYQRYRKLFTLHRKGSTPSVYCEYDLLKTFTLGIFDQQPFLNAILHLLLMPDIATISFDVLSRSPENMKVKVLWSKAAQQAKGKGFSISDGNTDMIITAHWITILPPWQER